jgi:hypothetical protein
MVDNKNLNRIKGILSARQGAEIPKYAGGAKFAKQKGAQLIYSADGKSWFTNADLTIPHIGSTDGFYDVSTKEMAPMEVPGDPKITPNTAVENAAKTQSQTQAQVQTQQAAAQAATTTKFTPPPPEPDLLSGLNAPTMPNQNGVEPVKLTSADKQEMQSAGRKVSAEKAQKFQNKQMAGQIAGQAVSSAMNAVGSAVAAKQQATDSDTTKTVDTVFRDHLM